LAAMTTYGYARVSTDGQTLDAQLEALKAAGCEKIFRERVSGARADRTELTKLLSTIDAGDVLIVSRLDRLARSTRDFLRIIDALERRGATFRSLGDQWADTTAPHGRLVLTVLGGLVEFERELIRARTGEGRECAKARGQHMGRPPRLKPHQRAEARKALADGVASQADLARRFGVSQSTISRLAGKAAAAPAPIGRAIDAETERAAKAFLGKLEGKYAVIEGILYGSRARGDFAPDSDADVAVILKGKRGDRAAASLDMAGVAFDVMMETGVMVQGLPLWAEELQRPERFSNPALIENILREGVYL
jgi:DNA invertase Pin-like site-specific DNA recombinase/predicted nucleotidyltransferase